MFQKNLKYVAATLAVASTLVTTSLTGHGLELCRGFLPENDMRIPVGYKSLNGGGITQEQFNEVIDRLIAIYGPELQAAGNRLRVNRRWDDPTVNASAQRAGKDYIVNMYGGLARHEAINVEGFALVMCHEIGHHIGGAPKVSGYMNNWATNEGGSDYFATLKCLRRFFAQDNNGALLSQADLDPLAVEMCTAQHPNMTDRLLCLRNSVAGQSVAGLFQALRKQPTAPQFGTPDSKTVTKTNDSHPDTQCRLDTYFQGALCPAPVDVPVSDRDVREGSCFQGQDIMGHRPRCWYAPGANGY